MIRPTKQSSRTSAKKINTAFFGVGIYALQRFSCMHTVAYLDMVVLGLAGFGADGLVLCAGLQDLSQGAGDGQPRHTYSI